MAAIRIIPCLDVKDGKVVKGVHFENLREAGDPVEHASFYSKENADEIVFLDISATIEGRKTMVDVVKRVSEVVFIPMTVGGGIKSVENIEELLKAGADKISINTSAVRNPELIKEGAKRFGSQCIIVAIDAKRIGKSRWEVYIESGKTPTGLDAVEWAKKVWDLGAGEILLTSIDMDGTQKGYDVELTKAVAESISIPVIASGGAGTLEHMSDVIINGKASAVLLASLLHFRKYTISQIKEFLKSKGIEVR
ncbi:MAG: imidazole glycerol phosphate synthase subunit HisF [Candidatus Omnitrophica bacterium]|nr:imidazole glycerol phosphate synthase subunit HisF [Candidatus Omnitrophota bacterium]MCM8777695.1 imidazole glycerol phosphate synthase subunit HisF [Candidatus Omnitrophota bacterium]